MKRELRAPAFFAAALLLTVTSGIAQTKTPYSATNKTVKVYVTAKNTNDRITQTETLHFTDKPQPVETEVAVFVDPSKTFQTMLGIGGAVTDASAETFYKLPKATQQEVMTAYFDKNKGI